MSKKNKQFAAELRKALVDVGFLPASTVVRRLRQSQGLTQEQLADLAGCSFSSIATYELGKTTATPQITDRILAALGHVGVMQIVVGLGIHGERHLKVIPNPLTQPTTEPTNPTE
jgi:transcriptional regulator with XRE-family HTH domain